jgi:hypothetical protein
MGSYEFMKFFFFFLSFFLFRRPLLDAYNEVMQGHAMSCFVSSLQQAGSGACLAGWHWVGVSGFVFFVFRLWHC